MWEPEDQLLVLSCVFQLVIIWTLHTHEEIVVCRNSDFQTVLLNQQVLWAEYLTHSCCCISGLSTVGETPSRHSLHCCTTSPAGRSSSESGVVQKTGNSLREPSSQGCGKAEDGEGKEGISSYGAGLLSNVCSPCLSVHCVKRADLRLCHLKISIHGMKWLLYISWLYIHITWTSSGATKKWSCHPFIVNKVAPFCLHNPFLCKCWQTACRLRTPPPPSSTMAYTLTHQASS